MNSNICIKDASFSIKENYIVIQREKGLLSISNSNNNGFNNIKTIIMYSISENNRKTSENPDEGINKFENPHVHPAILLTSADIKHHSIETLDYVTAIISAHSSCLYGAGETCDKNRESNAGSINIILLINKNLNYKSLMKAYSKALEAKISSLWDLDVRSGSWDLASGNNNDMLIVACTGVSNEEIDDDDELQYLVGKCVRCALGNALLKSGFSRNVVDYIEGIGIKIDDLVDAGMELCVGVEKSSALHTKLRMQILKSLEDLNVASFIIAGMRLEEDYIKHRVEGVNIDDDPAYLYSDEVIGMSIANQIAGTKAIFNFKRYDEEKPGIISKLGPVLDDVFAGLVAGCMSKIFEE